MTCLRLCRAVFHNASQHDGHSRTLVGAEIRPSQPQQRRPGSGGGNGGGAGNSADPADDFLPSLLLLDPSLPSKRLRDALTAGGNWGQMVRRGRIALERQRAYQVQCSVKPILHLVVYAREYFEVYVTQMVALQAGGNWGRMVRRGRTALERQRTCQVQ
jgi:hypothetical protein